jgi:uncharacterized phage-associated protein
MGIIEQKRINSVLFFASKSRDKKIDRLKLMKLLWLSDRIHLNRYGRTILDDKYYAMKCGPVLSETDDVSQKNIDQVICVNGFNIEAQEGPNLDYFSESDLEVMNLVWANYGILPPAKLVTYSHKFPEWKRYKKDLDKGPVKRFEMIMDDFFEDPEDVRFQSLVSVPKESKDHIKNVYRNSNAIMAWLRS